MSAAVSIVFVTHRTEPRFDWFADSLVRQAGDDDFEVVLVDGRHDADRTDRFGAAVRDRFAWRHVPAKPTPYAGGHRRTTRDFFAAASARNTGIVHVRAQYVVFVDDLSVLMPGWWASVQAAARGGDVVAGAYQKRRAMVVDNGVLLSSQVDSGGIDSRWTLGDDARPVPIGGAQLFGCSFGAPRDLLVEVNGFDEICDTVGGEDWHLGTRLEWAGAPIIYDRRMLTVESEELHHVGTPPLRLDRTAPPIAYVRRLREFGVGRRHVDGPWDTSHMILDILFGTGSVQTQGNYYLLGSLDAGSLPATVGRFPRYHWFDRRPLAAL
jgi:hypothetical protein